MKNLINILLIAILPLFGFTQNSAEECKVLVKELQGNYKGECKKGLAHGQGVAQGTDTYSGHFTKGLPHGKGKYVWSTGEAYDGKWKNGQRSGYGYYYFKDENGEEKFFKGIWMDDEYIGTEDKERNYVVERKQNFDRITAKKIGAGNTVVVKYKRAGANSLNTINDLKYVYSSGVEFHTGVQSGIENVEFPFRLLVSFTAPSKLRKRVMSDNTKPSDILRTMEIEINQPGYWELSLSY